MNTLYSTKIKIRKSYYGWDRKVICYMCN